MHVIEEKNDFFSTKKKVRRKTFKKKSILLVFSIGNRVISKNIYDVIYRREINVNVYITFLRSIKIFQVKVCLLVDKLKTYPMTEFTCFKESFFLRSFSFFFKCWWLWSITNRDRFFLSHSFSFSSFKYKNSKKKKQKKNKKKREDAEKMFFSKITVMSVFFISLFLH